MIYEVAVSGRYYNQKTVNRWNYLSTGTPTGVTGAFALLSAMGGIPTSGAFTTETVFGRWQDIVSPAFTYVSVLVKAIREAPTDFYDLAYATGVVGQGGGTGDMSPTAAFGFSTNRTRTDISRGTKRFAGVQESTVDAGGVIPSGTAGALALIAARMTDVLSYTDGGNSLTFAPVVCSKLKTIQDNGKPTYNYYDTIAEQLAHTMTGIVWSSYDTIRTQVSRQYGHGE